jgi:hypothetical protein
MLLRISGIHLADYSIMSFQNIKNIPITRDDADRSGQFSRVLTLTIIARLFYAMYGPLCYLQALIRPECVATA